MQKERMRTMSEAKTDDGGSAFPVGANEYGGHDTAWGMTLRDYFAAKAPTHEVVDLIGNTQAAAAKFIGIEAATYKPAEHYLPCITKARYMWADAMLAARQANTPNPLAHRGRESEER
jgi:hypothetical protein